MGRPKEYDREAVIEAARDIFWERGFEGTSIADLEARTGIDRSSLYQAFGNKRGMFEAVLDHYFEHVIGGMLSMMGSHDAGLEAIAAFFSTLAEVFRTDPRPLGCLMVNTTVELAGRNRHALSRSALYRDRLRETFAGVLERASARGEADHQLTRTRAYVLAAATMGVFVTAKVDAIDAADLCDALCLHVAGWRSESTETNDGEFNVQRP